MGNKNRETAARAQAAAQRREEREKLPTAEPKVPEEPDLLLHLWKLYQESPNFSPDVAEDCPTADVVSEFITFGRDWLRHNMPAGLDFSGPCAALRFQDGEVLPLVSFPPGEAPGIDGAASGGIPVNASTRTDGRGNTVATPTWGVTGQENRG